MMSKALLACLLLTLVSDSHCCTGELIFCDPAGGNCLCLRITGDPGTYRSCSSLTRQTYTNFGLIEIQPGSFQHADQLISLDLSRNAPPELTLHSRSFVGLTSLNFLNLEGNDLSTLPDCLFSPMIALETLNLQSNDLTELNSEAFRNLSSLKNLYLDNNSLTEFPSDLLEQLPALLNISLGSNLWNCSSDRVATLVQLVGSGLVVNADKLTCSNSTLVIDIVIEGTTPASSFIQSITPSSAATPTPSIASIPIPHPTLVPTILLTPAPVPQICGAVENSGTVYGFFDWPETTIGEVATHECPHGPEGSEASRECGEGGEWEGVEGSECNTASDTTQMLITIAESDISPSNIESVSLSLSLALSSPPSPSLTLDEVEVVLDIAGLLLNFTGASITVLNNSLQAVDYLLSYSGDSVAEGGPDISDRLRLLIDTALLSSLSMDNSNIVLIFSHLAVGGVYISGTNHTHILAIVSTGDEGEEDLVIGEGGGSEEGGCEEGGSEEGGGGDVEVEIDGELEGPVQVTVYNNNLFNTSSCVEKGIEGDEHAPVISVSDEPATSQETITITYHGVKVSDGEDVLCVRWNGSLNCGRGGWQTDGCQLRQRTGSDFICVCADNGTFTLLDTHCHTSSVQPGGSDITGVVVYVFYACCAVAAILYLPVIMAVILNRSLRVLPLKQCVANIAGSQALSLLAMAASYHPHTPRELCYSLAVLLHYTVLVALAWLAVYPVMAGLKVFRRTWFEHSWLLAPLAGTCWILPAVVVGAIGTSRYGEFTNTPDLCWSEADVFPNYFTFLSGFVTILTLLLTLLAICILCCSDYDLELPIHLRVASSQANAILYSVAIICHFLTANSVSHGSKYHLDAKHLLLTTAIFSIFSAGYFLLANGWANSHIRSVLLCREDPVLKRKVAHYQEPMHTPSSTTSNRSAEHRNKRRNGTHLSDEMNLNYVNSYLGYDKVSSSHVPLDMLGQVGQNRQGRRVKDKRNGELSVPMAGPSGFRHVGFKVPHVTSMV